MGGKPKCRAALLACLIRLPLFFLSCVSNPFLNNGFDKHAVDFWFRFRGGRKRWGG